MNNKESIKHFVTVIGSFANEDEGWFSKESFERAIEYTKGFLDERLHDQKTPKVWSRKGRCPSCRVSTGSKHAKKCKFDYKI